MEEDDQIICHSVQLTTVGSTNMIHD